MTTISEMPRFDRSWPVKSKVAWILDVDPTVFIGPFREVSQVAQSSAFRRAKISLRELNLNELSLKKYSSLKLSDSLSANEYKRISNAEDDDTFYGYFSKHINLLGVSLNRIRMQIKHSSRNGASARRLREFREEFLAATRDVFGFCTATQPFLERELKTRKRKQELNRKLRDATTTTTSISELAKEAKSRVSDIRSSETEKKAHVQSTDFLLEAEKHDAMARKWLKATGFFAIVTGIVAIYLYFDAECSSLCIQTECCSFVNWNTMVPRFSLVAVSLLFTLVASSIYRAEKHNSIVNKHRSISLEKYGDLAGTANLESSRDAITLLTANAIFAPQDTGFSRKQAPQIGNILDALSNLTNKEKN